MKLSASSNYAQILGIFMIQLVMVETVASKEISSRTLPTLHTWTGHDQVSPLLCDNSFNCSQITCSKRGPLLNFGYCATYDEKLRLLHVAHCPYFPLTDYDTSDPAGYIQLPANLSQLNTYMCGPLNRKGVLCSKCTDGFGPSVTSFKYKCANCTDAWYGVPLFLFLELVPLTLFYLVILVFRVGVTSPPMPCFILYCQLITAAVDLCLYGECSYRRVMFANNGDLRLYVKVIATLYGIFNLDFFRLFLPSFCISSQLKSIHVAFLGYISVFYPMILIFVTWACVELHGHNFRPIVLLWRPLHRCFVRLRRGWNTKNDICDVFATFFLLSYTKILHLTLLLMSTELDYTFDKSGNYTVKSNPLVDRSISYQGRDHLIFAIPSVILCFIFNVLPPFLLILYPLQTFRRCLSKCHLDFLSVSVFIERMQGHYRNGLNEDRDMRSFSGFYFFLIVFTYIGEACVHRSDYFKPFFLAGTLFLTAALTIAIIRPYQKARMNVLDSILLSIIAVIFYDLSADILRVLILYVLFLVPIVIILTLMLLHNRLCKASLDLMLRHSKSCKASCRICFTLFGCSCYKRTHQLGAHYPIPNQKNSH